VFNGRNIPRDLIEGQYFFPRWKSPAFSSPRCVEKNQAGARLRCSLAVIRAPRLRQ